MLKHTFLATNKNSNKRFNEHRKTVCVFVFLALFSSLIFDVRADSNEHVPALGILSVNDVLQVVLVLLIFCSTIVTAWQTRIHQVRLGRDHYLTAIGMINEVWEDLQKVLAHESNGNSITLEHASKVCMVLHQIGALVYEHAIPERFVDVHYYSIPRFRQAVSPLLEKLRSPGEQLYRGADYFWGIDVLTRVTLEHNAKLKREVNIAKKGLRLIDPPYKRKLR